MYESIIKNRPKHRGVTAMSGMRIRVKENKHIIITLSDSLMKEMNLRLGDRIDVLIDKDERTGLLRRDPEGLMLSRTSKDSKSQNSKVQINGIHWKSVPHVFNVRYHFTNGELEFDIPKHVLLEGEETVEKVVMA
jgi:hypothetical protein